MPSVERLNSEKNGIEADEATIAADIERRDAFDSGRAESPLKRAEDALLIDTTAMSIDEVVQKNFTRCTIRKWGVIRLGRFYQLAKGVASIYYRVMFKFEVEGLENVDPESHYVICGNHISLQDPIVIACILPLEIHYMAKKELFKNKIFGKFLSALGVFSS